MIYSNLIFVIIRPKSTSYSISSILIRYSF